MGGRAGVAMGLGHQKGRRGICFKVGDEMGGGSGGQRARGRTSLRDSVQVVTIYNAFGHGYMLMFAARYLQVIEGQSQW